MQVQMEKNMARKYHRIELPAQVSLNNKNYHVKDWSLGGFLLTDLQDGEINIDWNGTLKLILPFQGVDVAFDIEAKVAWVRGDKAGFTFTDVSPRVKKILKSYVEASIEGRLGEADGIITRVDGLEVPIDVEKPFSEEEEKIFITTFYSKSALYWILGSICFIIVSIIIFFNMSQAGSVRAIVSAPLVNIDSPFEGLVASLNVKEGDTVQKGQILAGIDDQDLMRSVKRQRYTLTVYEGELNEARVRLAEEEKAISLYISAASLTLTGLAAERAGAKANLDLADKDFKRASALLASNAINKAAYDEKLRTLNEESSRVKAIDERIKLAKINNESIGNGKYLSTNGEVRGDVDLLKARIEVMEARVKEEEARLYELLGKLEKTKLISPCDGTVYVIKQTPGTYVREGDGMLTVRPKFGAEGAYPWVLARFTFEDAQSISPGSVAFVSLPSLGLNLKGRVQALGHQALSSAKSFSPDLEITLSEVPVKIVLDNPDERLHIGLAAVVSVQTSFTTRLKAKFGRIL